MFLTQYQVERFWQKVNKTEDCWFWLASTNGTYGKVHLRPHIWLAHRLAYVLTYGEISKNLVIDHMCNQPLCVRPDHLQAITQKQNVLRSANPIAKQMLRTRCPKGHKYDYFWKNRRYCRKCRKDNK